MTNVINGEIALSILCNNRANSIQINSDGTTYTTMRVHEIVLLNILVGAFKFRNVGSVKTSFNIVVSSLTTVFNSNAAVVTAPIKRALCVF